MKKLICLLLCVVMLSSVCAFAEDTTLLGPVIDSIDYEWVYEKTYSEAGSVAVGPDGEIAIITDSLIEIEEDNYRKLAVLNPDGTEKFVYGMDFESLCTPVFDEDGNLYGGCSNYCGTLEGNVNYIFAVSPEGEELWKREFTYGFNDRVDDWYYFSFEFYLFGDTLVTKSLTNILGLDKNTGEIKWEIKNCYFAFSDAEVSGSDGEYYYTYANAYYDNDVYVGNSILKIDPQIGEVVDYVVIDIYEGNERRDHSNDYIFDDEGNLYISAIADGEDMYILKINTADMTIVEDTFIVRKADYHLNISNLALYDGKLYLTNSKLNRYYTLDLETKEVEEFCTLDLLGVEYEDYYYIDGEEVFVDSSIHSIKVRDIEFDKDGNMYMALSSPYAILIKKTDGSVKASFADVWSDSKNELLLTDTNVYFNVRDAYSIKINEDDNTETEQKGTFVYRINEDYQAVILKYKGNEANIEVPEKINGYPVTEITDEVFNESVETVKIPETITKIDDNAFARCEKLTTVYYSGNSQQWNEAFTGTLEDVTINCEPVKGDINSDGKLSIIDVVLARAHIVKTKTLTEDQFVLADMNDDGKVNITDVVIMRSIIVNG